MNKLNFNEIYILENEVALLRPLTMQDFDNLLPYSINEPTLWTYSLVSAGGGADQMRHYLNLAMDKKAKQDSYPFIIFDKRIKEYAGSTRFYDYQAHHNTVQLGYTWYGKKFWGTGLNKNCKYLILQFAFETLGLDRVEFRADNNNARSIAAMKSLGCTVEGVLRQNCATEVGRRDSIVLSILKDEWFGGVGEKLLLRC